MKLNKQNRLFAISSLLLASLQMIGFHYNGIADSYGWEKNSILFFIVFLGISIVFFAMQYCFLKIIRILSSQQSGSFYTIQKHLVNNKLIFYSVIILIAWLPFIILQYRGILCPDSAYQIEQAVHIFSLTKHHPILNTLLVGSFVKLGRLLRNANIGISLFVICQVLFSALVLGYSLKTLDDYHVKPSYIMICIIIYIFVPNYNHFISVVIKDQLYAMFFLLFMILLARITIEGADYICTKSRLVLWVISIVGVTATRNNGIYVIILTAIGYTIYAIYKGNSKKMIILWIVPALLYFGVERVAEWRFRPLDGMHASALSLPLQQTARYVKYYGNEITEKEMKAIDGVLVYNKLSDSYTPVCSDPVKAIFREDTYSTNKLFQYMKTWIYEFVKHPNVYFDAVSEQSYYLFDLSSNSNAYYSNAYVIENDKMFADTGIKISKNELKRQETAIHYDLMFDKIPILNLLNSMAFYSILLVMLFFVMINDRRKKELLLLIPLFLSILVIIAGPVANGNQRYAFPIIYSMPMLIGMYCRSPERKH